jgi:hypothetical protein
VQEVAVSESGYVPPPPFAPPPLRVAPLNETAVLGRTSYPHEPLPGGAYGYAPPYATYPPPVAWYPPAAWQPRHLDESARRRRTVSVLAAMAVVTALVALCTVLLTSSHGTHRARSLSLPTAVDNYTKVGTLDGSRIRSMFSAGAGAFGSLPASDLDGARVGVYASLDDSEPTLLFIGFTGHDSPSIATQLRADPAATIAADVLSGAGATTRSTTVDAGPLGGAMRCAIVDLGGQNASAGVWADSDTLGIVLIVDSTVPAVGGSTTAQTSAVTRDFRAKAEH